MYDLATISRSDQTRALGMSTLAFTVCFAVWTIFSIIGVGIREQLGLSDTQFGLLVGTPILTGSLTRIFLGIWTDQYGGRIVNVIVMALAAAATFLLSYADTYAMMLVAALGVGLAGGSFAVGVAYVARWYPKEKQGTALGIFGAGNVGAAVTKFVAPFVMVAYGWEMVAQVWAIALLVSAAIFWFTTSDDPALVERRRRGVKARGALLELAPLKSLQVWRFSLYYFFVFGAFVALALWLPRYLVGVYDMDIKSAGMLAAFYSVPASLFRIYGGVLSDRYGARRVMYWTFGVSVACLFLLSYPAADYVIHGIDSDIRFTLAMGIVPFVALIFVLGFFMRSPDLRAGLLHESGQGRRLQAHPGLLPGSYRRGRRAGRHDGRSRRLHPADCLRRAERSDRHLDQLLHAAVRAGGHCAGLDASGSPADGARRRRCRAAQIAGTAGNARNSYPQSGRRTRPAPDRGLAARGQAVLGGEGTADRTAQSLAVDPGTATLLRGVDGLVGGGGETAADRL